MKACEPRIPAGRVREPAASLAGILPDARPALAPFSRAWRAALALRFRLFQRRYFDRLVVERISGHSIVVLPNVLNPRLFFSGELLAEILTPSLIPAGSSVLDVGTGSGVLAVAAAELADRVKAIDLNPQAVRCARANAILNGCENRMEVLQGDLFEPIPGERFDVVLCNPPYFRGEARGPLEMALRAEDFAERFASGLAAHLSEGGCALVVLSSIGDEAGFLGAAQENGFAIEVAWRRPTLGEVFTVYRLTPDRGGE